MDYSHQIEIVYNPLEWNISKSRRILRKALLMSGLGVNWEEWKKGADSIPESLDSEFHFSLFLDGQLIYNSNAYLDSEDELSKLIQKAITKPSKSWKLKEKIGKINWSFLPALGLTLLPKCPLCWAAYMSVFSGLGLGAVEYQTWFLPFLSISLSISMGIAIYQAISKKRFTYMWLILGGASLIFVGKLVLNIDWLMYLGLFLLGFAILWLRYRSQILDLPVKSYRKLISKLS